MAFQYYPAIQPGFPDQCFVVVELLSCVRLFVTPCAAACQASLSFTSSQNLLKLMSIESVMQFNHLIFCCPLLFLSSVFPSIRVFSNDLALHIRWPKYWSFGFSIGPSNEYSGFSVHKNHFILYLFFSKCLFSISCFYLCFQRMT